MNLRALSCPVCSAPISVQATVCTYCRSPVHVPAQLELVAARTPTRIDFTLGATPREVLGLQGVVMRPGVGMEIEVPPGIAIRGIQTAAWRNASARVEGVVHDPDGGLDVGLRVVEAGDALIGYLVQARPTLQQFTVSRFARLADTTVGREVLVAWRSTEALRIHGNPNRIELLAADSLIQVRINDVLVARLDDPFLGYGKALWGVVSHGQKARVTLTRFEHGPI